MAIKVGEKDLFPYLGDYGPVSIYKGEQKLAGYKWAEKSGQELYFDNTYNSLVEVEVDGQSSHSDDSILTLDKLGNWYTYNTAPTYDANTDTVTFTYLNPQTGGLIAVNNLDSFKGDRRYIISGYAHINGSPLVWSSGRLNNINPAANSHSFYTNSQTGYFEADETYTSAWLLHTVIRGAEHGDIITIRNFKAVPVAPHPDMPKEIHSLNDFDVVSSVEKLSEGQLQEYDYGVEYENVDKINLNLDEPLRSVGDVKDRLFRDNSDGLWKVERNVGERVFDGSEDWKLDKTTNGGTSIKINYLNAKAEPTNMASNLLQFNSYWASLDGSGNGISGRPVGGFYIRLLHDIVDILDTDTSSSKLQKIKDFIGKEGLQVIYLLANPTIETLPDGLQDQLNTLKSFHESNYVYTVIQDDGLTPMIHAKTEVKDI